MSHSHKLITNRPGHNNERWRMPAVDVRPDHDRLDTAEPSGGAYIDWEWFKCMIEDALPAGDTPRLFTSGMIARDLGVSRNRVRNVLDNHVEAYAIIQIGGVKLYDDTTWLDVQAILDDMDGYGAAEDGDDYAY